MCVDYIWAMHNLADQVADTVNYILIIKSCWMSTIIDNGFQPYQVLTRLCCRYNHSERKNYTKSCSEPSPHWSTTKSQCFIPLLERLVINKLPPIICFPSLLSTESIIQCLFYRTDAGAEEGVLQTSLHPYSIQTTHSPYTKIPEWMKALLLQLRLSDPYTTKFLMRKSHLKIYQRTLTPSSVTTSLRSLTAGYTLSHTEAWKGSGRVA